MKIEKIRALLRELTVRDLQKVEEEIHSAYRRRGVGIVYDDAYGVLTEVDLLSTADEAFQELDRDEEHCG